MIRCKTTRKTPERSVPHFITLDESHGLLMAYINDQAAQHIAPLRKGTPRGEPVGLSHEKYIAACLSLLSLPLAEIAKAARVSYGLLRKWRTEDAFTETIDHHAKAFVEHTLLPFLRTFEREKETMSEEDYWMWSDHDDPSAYSEVVTKTILAMVGSKGKLSLKDADLLFEFIMRQLISAEKQLASKKSRKRWLGFVIELNRILSGEQAFGRNQSKLEQALLAKAGHVLKGL